MVAGKNPPVRVTLFTRRDCRLCDKASATIARVSHSAGIPLELTEIDVDGDPGLVDRFGLDVPVVFIAERFAFRHQVDPEIFLELIRSARSQPPIRSELSKQNCEPCRGGMSTVDEQRASVLLGQIQPGWRIIDGHHLRKELTFPDFRSALAFVNEIGRVAEEEGHHPDLTLAYGRVAIETWTHAAGGLTENDFILAAKIDDLSPGLYT